MRFSVPGYPYLYATACKARHAAYLECHRLADLKRRSRAGGHMTAGTTQAQHVRDVAEVRAYLAAHPGAKRYDVELELHYTRKAALRLMKEARGWVH